MNREEALDEIEALPLWDTRFEQVLRPYCRLVAAAGPIDPDASFAELGVDSLGVLGLIVDTEEAFGIELPMDMLTEDTLAGPAAFWRTVSGLVGGKPTG